MERNALQAQPQTFKRPDRASLVTVPGDGGKELAPGTLNAIPKKAGLR
jgi:predicted RNA binding protein YcfA (HicA-like mRNA interferase family)